MFTWGAHNQVKEPTGAKAKRAETAPARKGAPEYNSLWQSLALRPAGIQPKLAVSQAYDPHEREADQVADRVMRMPERVAPEACPACAEGGSTCPKCEGEQTVRIQRKNAPAPGAIGASVPNTIVRNLGPGALLNNAARTFFESRFGYDFSDVRIHAGAEAARSAEAINSLAFTYDRDIVFGHGQFDPISINGRRLIAHELAHVVQQSGSGRLSVQRQPKKDSPWSDWWPPDFKPICPECPIEPPSTKDAAEGICKLDPSNPICKFYHLEPPPSSKTICAPGYHGSTSSTFKDQCCKDGQPESMGNCCPKERMGDGRCCVEGEVAVDGHCKKIAAVDPKESCAPPGRKSPSGDCCLPPKVPGAWGCEEKKEEPKPLVFDTFVDRFTVLFNENQPQAGQSFESSLAGGRGDLDQAISLLKQDLSTGAQLVANASNEGEPERNLDLTDRRLEAVRAEMKDVSWKLRDPMPPMGDVSGCRGSWGAYSCGVKNADPKTIRPGDRNVIIRLFRPTELKLTPRSNWLWPPKFGK